MDWLIILSGAIDGAAVALAIVALVFGYRAMTDAIRDQNFLSDMHRQAAFGTVAVLAGLLAAALLVIGQMAF